MDNYVLLTGLLIFVARVLDVSIGTIRTIVTVQGRMVIAFCLGIVETTLWIFVVGTVVNKIQEQPVLVVFYALGFATGNVVGIIAEKKLAFGPIILKIITHRKSNEIKEAFLKLFLNVTCFEGQGSRGPVMELYVVCRRRDLKTIIPIIRNIDANAFYVTEQVRDVSRDLRPLHTPENGWGTIFTTLESTNSEICYAGDPSVELNVALKPFNTQLTGWRAVLKKK